MEFIIMDISNNILSVEDPVSEIVYDWIDVYGDDLLNYFYNGVKWDDGKMNYYIGLLIDELDLSYPSDLLLRLTTIYDYLLSLNESVLND